MKGTMERKLGVILPVGCLALGAATCGKTSAAGYSNDFVSYEETRDRFVRTCESLNWPESYKVPKEVDYKEDGLSHEKGSGATRASLYWRTVWEREWLDSYKIGLKRAEKVLAGLERATKVVCISPIKCDDTMREAFAKHLDQARHGDPSGFEENIKLSTPE